MATALLVSASMAHAQVVTMGRDSGRLSGRIGALDALGSEHSPELAAAIRELLSDENAHMRMAPRRTATRDDSTRAAELVRVARTTLAKYKDVRLAEADGYLRFLPNVEPQPIYHYTNYEHAYAASYVMDPMHPTSLLYRRSAGGKLVLVGAMYTAPPDATPEELDARLPSGMAHWHEHVNFCGPWPDDVRAGRQKVDGAAVARWLRISTRSACDAAGGRFIPRLFGWMAHVYLFVGDDPRAIWGDDMKARMKQ
jgi:hypothetical protein